jgi:hypothetical protein
MWNGWLGFRPEVSSFKFVKKLGLLSLVPPIECECRVRRDLGAVVRHVGNIGGHSCPFSIPQGQLSLDSKARSGAKHRSSQNRRGLVSCNTMNATLSPCPTGAGVVDAPEEGVGQGYWRLEELGRVVLDESHRRWDSCAAEMENDSAGMHESHERWDHCAAKKCESHAGGDLCGEEMSRSQGGWDGCEVKICESHAEGDSCGKGMSRSHNRWDPCVVNKCESHAGRDSCGEGMSRSHGGWDSSFSILAICHLVKEKSHGGWDSCLFVPESDKGILCRSPGGWDSGNWGRQDAAEASQRPSKGLSSHGTGLSFSFITFLSP